jgi:YNFM family putative membrane transporter
MVRRPTYENKTNNILDGWSDAAKNAPMSSALPASLARQQALSLFLIGFITFALLYAVQPLLPLLARAHRLSAASSALALSVSTGALALAIWLCAARASAWDRRRLMLGALLLATLLNAASAFTSSWPQLLLCRALMGLCLGAVPAMAMAHVAETAAPGEVASAMGLYVAGTALGGMTGRVGLGLLADLHGWTVGLLSVSALTAAGVGLVWRWMPTSPPARMAANAATAATVSTAARWVPRATWWALLASPPLRRLFVCGGLASGIFVSVYNYAGFRLQAEPFSLRPAQIGLIFGCYAFGVMSSSVAGRLARRWGQPRVLTGAVSLTAAGLLVSQSAHLAVFVAGLSLMTMGFFAMHAVCSGWVGQMAPQQAKAQATALYLLSYYIGASLLGYAGGWAWGHGGWGGLSTGLLAALLVFIWAFRGVTAALAPLALSKA